MVLTFIMFDQAWNPATEEQCIDRCHRLGQNRKVVVTKVRNLDSASIKLNHIL